MKKYIPILLSLCLLLTACGGGGEASSTPATTTPTGAEPYYSSYGVRSMRLTVTSGTDQLEGMGDLNNLYQQQAAKVYQILNTPAYNKSYLSPPTGTPWVRLTFRPHSDPAGETYTLYENDLVVIQHPAAGEQTYTAPAGTYYQTVTLLNALRTQQSRYVTLKGYEQGDSAGYTIHYAGGSSEFFSTGTDRPAVDLVGEGLVRVCFRGATAFYDTVAGKNTMLAAAMTDVAGEYVAAASRDGMDLYPLLSKKSIAHVYAAVEEESHTPVQGISFSEDGKSLHIVGVHRDAVVWDRTLPVAELVDGTVRYLLGDWQTSGGDPTEMQQQNVGYQALKKLRHKEKELGHTFSATPKKQFALDGVAYFLTEIGYWEEQTYTVVTNLMVRKDMTAGYEATPGENELTWDTAKNWFKQ